MRDQWGFTALFYTLPYLSKTIKQVNKKNSVFKGVASFECRYVSRIGSQDVRGRASGMASGKNERPATSRFSKLPIRDTQAQSMWESPCDISVLMAVEWGRKRQGFAT